MKHSSCVVLDGLKGVRVRDAAADPDISFIRHMVHTSYVSSQAYVQCEKSDIHRLLHTSNVNSPTMCHEPTGLLRCVSPAFCQKTCLRATKRITEVPGLFERAPHQLRSVADCAIALCVVQRRRAPGASATTPTLSGS